MKKFLCSLAMVLICLTGCKQEANTEGELQEDTIYFFYSEGCPHCQAAEQYIQQKYQNNLKMELVNVSTMNGHTMLLKCVRKFALGNRIGTPLFCMGDNHLMGWSRESEMMFDAYAKNFLK